MPEPDEPMVRLQVPAWTQFPLFSCVFLFGVSAYADELKISPTVLLSEGYNDNIYLTGNGPTTSAFITEAMPGVIVAADGPSFKLNLNYAVQELNYSGGAHSEQTNQILSADTKEEFVKNLFYFQGSTNISQQDYSAFAPQATNNLTLSNNRYEVRTYDLEPYFQSNFSQAASGEIRYIHNYVDTTNGGLINSSSDTVRAFLKSGPAFKSFDWNLSYSDQKINYQSSNDLEMQNTILSGGYHISSETNLTASVGYEKNNYLTQNGQKPQGDDWSVGFKWTPSKRTSLTASFGRHYYGDSYTLIFDERTYATVWNLGYNDGLMTSRGEFLIPTTTNTNDFLNSLWQSSIPDQTQRQQAIDAFIQNTGLPGTLTTPVNTLTDQVFLQKNLQGSVALSGKRNTLLLSLFNIQRNIQSVSLALPGNNEMDNTRQTGASIMWNHDLTPRTNAVIMESISNNISNSANFSFKSNTFTASLNHQYDPKLNATLRYQRIQSSSNPGTFTISDNLLSLMLAFKF